MRTSEQIEADARPGRAFSNSTSFEYWADKRGGCWTCRNDDDATEKYCPILSVALATGKTPAEWVELSDRIQDYTCTEYDERRDDGGGDEPKPDPAPRPAVEIDGQIDMFEVFADQVIDQATAAEAVNSR